MVPPTDEPTIVTYFDLKDKLKKYEQVSRLTMLQSTAIYWALYLRFWQQIAELKKMLLSNSSEKHLLVFN